VVGSVHSARVGRVGWWVAGYGYCIFDFELFFSKVVFEKIVPIPTKFKTRKIRIA